MTSATSSAPLPPSVSLRFPSHPLSPLQVSLGAVRHFDFRHKSGTEKARVELGSGSLVVMAGDTQKNYKHGVPVQKSVLRPRINLTFRHVRDPLST